MQARIAGLLAPLNFLLTFLKNLLFNIQQLIDYCDVVLLFQDMIVWLTFCRSRQKKLNLFRELAIPGPAPNLVFGNLLSINGKVTDRGYAPFTCTNLTGVDVNNPYEVFLHAQHYSHLFY